MTKTTALTFVTAVVLLAAAVTLEFYGHSIVTSQRAAARDSSGYTFYDGYDRYSLESDTWERASGLTGLLAIAVSLAGAMLWDREDSPGSAPRSILMLERRGARRAVRSRTPLKTACRAELHVDESRAHLHEDENLTPLERVIRGY